MNKQKAALATLSSLFLFMPTTFVESATISGNIGVSLTVNSTCLVNNLSSGTFGTLAFGQVADLNNNVDAEVGSSGLSVLCSSGTAAVLTIGSGSNGTSSVRRLTNGAGTPTLISYRLYSNSARSSEIAIGGTLNVPAGTGVAQTVPIYGQIVSSEQTLKYPPVGNYTDTITATLTWN
ncbi:MAG: spore coat U domain-containing protein [Symbiopectobacterium sp.]|uniref:Csu type fimbrial protein n=1 Tax=Symbiopectobacterium sp. TaxID=2952789 RepID=UPI0039E80D20